MTIFGLNSPEIFIILVIVLAILGPKRWERGFALFLKLLKFLLSNEVNQSTNFPIIQEKQIINEYLKDKSSLLKNEDITEPAKQEEVKEVLKAGNNNKPAKQEEVEDVVKADNNNPAKQEEAEEVVKANINKSAKQEEVEEVLKAGNNKPAKQDQIKRKDEILVNQNANKQKVSSIKKTKRASKKEIITANKSINAKVKEKIIPKDDKKV